MKLTIDHLAKLPLSEQHARLSAAVQGCELTSKEARRIAHHLGWSRDQVTTLVKRDQVSAAVRAQQHFRAADGGTPGAALGHQQRLLTWHPQALFDDAGLPRFADLTPAVLQRTIEHQLDVTHAAFSAFEARVATLDNPSWDQVVVAASELQRGLDESYAVLSYLRDVKRTDALVEVNRILLPRLVELGQRIDGSPVYYAALDRLARASELPPERRHVLGILMAQARRAGVHLDAPARARLTQLRLELGEAERTFGENLMGAPIPERADNADTIAQILSLRRAWAEQLGYANYAEMIVSTRMAESPAAARQFLEELSGALLAGVRADEAELDAFIEERRRADTEAPDAAYREVWIDLLFEARFGFALGEHDGPVSYEAALAAFFALAHELYGVTVRESDTQPAVWDEAVRLYHIHDRDGALLGRFFLDPLARPEEKRTGAWVLPLRRRLAPHDAQTKVSDAPLVMATTNIAPRRDAHGAQRIMPREVRTLYHELGHVLQSCLATSVDAGHAPSGGVEWDAIEIPSKLMERFRDDPALLAKLLADPETGAPAEAELVDRVIASRRFRQARSRLALVAPALADLYLHGDYDPARDGDAATAVTRHLDALGIPGAEGYGTMLNRFRHIFSGGYAAGYYGYAWSDACAADIYATLSAARGNERERLGDALRETLFARGGSAPSRELVSSFLGRALDPQALLRDWGVAGHWQRR